MVCVQMVRIIQQVQISKGQIIRAILYSPSVITWLQVVAWWFIPPAMSPAPAASVSDSGLCSAFRRIKECVFIT